MESWLRITLVTLTVGGGFAGVASTIQSLYRSFSRQEGAALYLAMVLFLSLYSYITISGLFLVQNPNLIRPIAFALALQIPRFSSPWIAYRLTAGLELFCAIQPPNINWGFYFGSRWSFELFQGSQWSFGINLLAPVLLILVLRSAGKRRLGLHKEGIATEVESTVAS